MTGMSAWRRARLLYVVNYQGPLTGPCIALVVLYSQEREPWYRRLQDGAVVD